jgi:CheY-like chemotaxis protein
MRRRSLRILIIDQNPTWIRIMKDKLENEGYRVATADSDHAAVGMAPFRALVVVSDAGMGVAEGRQLLAKVRIDDGRVPLIGVTAERARLVPDMPGAFRVFGKPVALEGVLAAMADFVPSRQARLTRLLNSFKRHSPSAEPLGSDFGRRSTSPGWRERIAASPALSFLSSFSARRLGLLTVIVVSSVILVRQLAPRVRRAT